MRNLKLLFLALIVFAPSPACVSLSEHELLQRRLSATQLELQALKEERMRLRKHLDTNSNQMDELNRELNTRDSRQEASRMELARAQAANRELADSLSAKDKALLQAAEAKDEQQRMFLAYRNKLKSLIESKDLTLTLVDGKLVVSMPSDILFASGSASISERGQSTIMEVGRVLQGTPDKRLQVEGHTDNVPIRGGRFASNWQLGHGRAMAVVEILVRAAVPAAQLSAASFGEHQPKVANTDDESRQKNRRIEIVVMPNLDAIAEQLSNDGTMLAH